MHDCACCVFRLNGRLLGSLGCMGCLLVYLACVTNSVHMTSAVEAHGEGAPSPFLGLVIRTGYSRGYAGELARRGITPPKGPLRFRRSKRRRRAPSSPQHMDPIEAEVERWFDLKWTPASEYQKKMECWGLVGRESHQLPLGGQACTSNISNTGEWVSTTGCAYVPKCPYVKYEVERKESTEYFCLCCRLPAPAVNAHFRRLVSL